MFSVHRSEGAGVFVESQGIEFEDFEPGWTFEHRPGRTMTIEDARAHSFHSLDLRPAAFDDRYAESLSLQGRLPETLVFAVAAAMTTKTFARVIANLAMTDVVFPAPAIVGDTLYSETEILEKRESRSRADRGLLAVATTARNQRGEIVCAFHRRLLIYRRGHGPYTAAGY
jgi:itaconyl-CoA hydratase